MRSEFELGGCAARAEYTATLTMPTKVLEHSAKNRIELHRQPIGVVGSITPWNWPLLIAVWHILPALRAGNTVVIKPSPFTPLSTLRLIEVINQVLPKGVVNALASGRKVMTNAALTLKVLTLELGGNDAGIVLPDADVEHIVEPLFWGAFINFGQTCGALERLYVHDSLYDRVCQALTAYLMAARVPFCPFFASQILRTPLNAPMIRSSV
jgi:acyl-CoA reductase-like NAD-dependent aldehyde dehydrogenase